MMVKVCPQPEAPKQQSSADALGVGRAMVIFCLAYLLLLGSLPLGPLLSQMGHGHARSHCTEGVCHCKPGCTHHHGNHHGTAPAQPDKPALQTCGDNVPGWVMLTLDKAFVVAPFSLLPRMQPPLLRASHPGSPSTPPTEDIFHPPRLA